MPRPRPPAERRWSAAKPLPRRVITSKPVELPPVNRAPSHIHTGEPGEPFDFTRAMRRLCVDICSKCPALYHIECGRLLFDITPSRENVGHGLQARVTPMRFEGGALTTWKDGREIGLQRFFLDGREVLYIVTFALPRFLNRAFEDKLITVVHELYHIGPFFDGDLRRHEGRNHLHTDDKKAYDLQMAGHAKEYMQNGPDQAALAFLRLDYSQLCARHGNVVGDAAPRPKLLASG